MEPVWDDVEPVAVEPVMTEPEKADQAGGADTPEPVGRRTEPESVSPENAETLCGTRFGKAKKTRTGRNFKKVRKAFGIRRNELRSNIVRILIEIGKTQASEPVFMGFSRNIREMRENRLDSGTERLECPWYPLPFSIMSDAAILQVFAIVYLAVGIGGLTDKKMLRSLMGDFEGNR